MKRITYEEWCERFDAKRPLENDPVEYSSNERESLVFYDNGAVANADGDFIVKADQVEGR